MKSYATLNYPLAKYQCYGLRVLVIVYLVQIGSHSRSHFFLNDGPHILPVSRRLLASPSS
jgi:hypothetical protein